MSVSADDQMIRRAFQLARLSEELALMSERLEYQPSVRTAHRHTRRPAD
jgi:hypothetical protein